MTTPSKTKMPEEQKRLHRCIATLTSAERQEVRQLCKRAGCANRDLILLGSAALKLEMDEAERKAEEELEAGER